MSKHSGSRSVRLPERITSWFHKKSSNVESSCDELLVASLSEDEPHGAVAERYRRFRKAAEAEKQWIHERLSWLFVPQGILFTAFGLTYRTMPMTEKPIDIVKQLNLTVEEFFTVLNYFRGMLVALGFLIAVIVLLTIVGAAVMHHVWTRSLKNIARHYPYDFPFGQPPAWPAILSMWLPPLIPMGFAFFWVLIGWKMLKPNIFELICNFFTFRWVAGL